MFRPVELFIGLRYTRAKRRNHFISFISVTSIVGIALGVTALITVLSVMNGFQREVRTGILGMASHATVSSLNGTLADWRELVDEMQRQPRVLGAAPFIEAQGMLSYGQAVSGALIRGVLPEQEPQVSFIGEKMIRGRLEDLRGGEFGIILGRDLAGSLGVGVGDKVTLVTPQASVTPLGTLPRLKRFTVAGLFYVGNNEYDRALALMHMEDAARLFQTGGSATGVRLKLDDIYAAPLVARALRQQLPRDLAVTDWTQQHVNFFRAVAIEKRMMFIILTLIVAVAAFNIVSTLVMVVQDKKADIAILRTLGITPRSVMAVFMVQGSIIGVFGTLLGVVGGVLLALNVETVVPFIEQVFGIRFLSPDVYLISEVPSELHWDDVVNIGSVALILGLLSTLYPAWRAARTQPAEALRYE
ncbi:MAG: lipoprotein-releasing ABC transporter permease subunit [Gammaproteobacteria bacterium]|nr:MAG: lipoprotein-releasing ABC transporter permease subunit [Gammaproteobacteria bacterium]